LSLRYAFPPDPFLSQRERMVRDQIERRGVRDERVLEAMRAVPRHLFLPAGDRSSAYDDTPLPIGSHQTISQPYIVAYMTETLRLRGTESVLEIGTGSGYQTAVLACLARTVTSIERIPELAERARENLRTLAVDNAEIAVGDGTAGCPERAPFDAVLITAGTPAVPQPLLDQLAPGGRLLAPVGGRSVQELELWTRSPDGLHSSRLIAVVFVPLIGAFGWKD
jgi:protein-L-isoaspartate(D-aspartate) O-methyltransferase